MSSIATTSLSTDPFGLSLPEAKRRLVAAFERLAIESTLERTEGNVSAAARILGIHRQSLQRKMLQLNIPVKPALKKAAP